jgi:hypothetical protein
MYTNTRLIGAGILVALVSIGCTAQTEPMPSEHTNVSREVTGTTSAAFGSGCTGQNAVIFASGSSGWPATINFGGWCFSEGDNIEIIVTDNTNSRNLIWSGPAVAGPDNAWFPGAISGSFNECSPYSRGSGVVQAKDFTNFQIVESTFTLPSCIH